MNGIKYLIDTCTLIGLQKQSTQSLELLSNKQAFINECAISIVTYMEFVGFYGVDKSTALKLEQIANTFTQLPINKEVMMTTVGIRQRHKIKLPDAMILATAKHYQLELLTLDDRLARIASQI